MKMNKEILTVLKFLKVFSDILKSGINILYVKFSAALHYICMIRRGDGLEPVLVFRVYPSLFPLTGFH